jgi:heme/copper-type cytochrome/quinol oxidase subunit 2
MQVNYQRRDRFLLILLLAIVIGLPAGISVYDRAVWRNQIPPDAKVFTLTGHTDRGWILGDVRAYDILGFGDKSLTVNKPTIRVHKGDRVVLKLKSSDVIHGFSLKELGIFIDDGIPPGKVRLVSFVADRAGTFTFSCNAICGANHEKMQGTLVVTA